ncbi:hypothetical protein ACP4OV_004553 [Aristida adscensionis]
MEYPLTGVVGEEHVSRCIDVMDLSPGCRGDSPRNCQPVVHPGDDGGMEDSRLGHPIGSSFNGVRILEDRGLITRSGEPGDGNTPATKADILEQEKSRKMQTDGEPFSFGGDWTQVSLELLTARQPIERNVVAEIDQSAELPENYSDPEIIVVAEIDQTAELPENYSDPEIMVPKVGQCFKTDTDAYNLYNIYSLRQGFGIRLNKCRLNVAEKKTMQEMCCTHQGHNPKTKKPSMRVGCPAMIRVNRGNDDEFWRVTKVVLEHNHAMKQRIGETKNYPSHSRVDEGTKCIIADMVDSGIKSSNMYGLLAGLHGGPSMVPFSRRVMDRIAYAIKRDECSDDVQKTLAFFEEMQRKSKNFFYSVLIDKACRVRNIFWAHAISRMNFELYGDVVTFDTTYRTNKYEMPFAPFIGVNNHFQSTLFGGALLRDESTESFKWLFKTFKKCMNGKGPKAILTDNCRAMEVAIADVFPDAVHRVCKWHVLKKAKERLGNIYSGKRSSFKDDFHKLLNQSLTSEEFEGGWKALLAKYELQKCTYLEEVWDMREKWAFVYFAEHFFAGMTTTQRSECANHIIKDYVGPSCSMFGFVKGYERFLHDRLQAEDREEFHSGHVRQG